VASGGDSGVESGGESNAVIKPAGDTLGYTDNTGEITKSSDNEHVSESGEGGK